MCHNTPLSLMVILQLSISVLYSCLEHTNTIMVITEPAITELPYYCWRSGITFSFYPLSFFKFKRIHMVSNSDMYIINFCWSDKPPTLLISLDGFRYDYLRRDVTPVINWLGM